MSMNDKAAERVGTLENTIQETKTVLSRAMEQSVSDNERLSYSLRLAVDPAWSTWIKESGAKPSQIAEALIHLVAALLAEAASNIAKPDKKVELVRTMSRIVAEKAEAYCDDGAKLADVASFRRGDS